MVTPKSRQTGTGSRRAKSGQSASEAAKPDAYAPDKAAAISPPPSEAPDTQAAAPPPDAPAAPAAPAKSAAGGSISRPAASKGTQQSSPGTGGNSSGKGGSGSGGRPTKKGDSNVPKILFLDARDAEDRATRKLNEELKNLRLRAAKSSLTSDEQKTLDLLEELLIKNKPGYALEDTYVTLRDRLSKLLCKDSSVPTLRNGHFGDASGVDNMTYEDKVTAAVWGKLTGDGMMPPKVLDALDYANGELRLPAPTARFAEALTQAFARYNSHPELYSAVLKVMAEASDVNATGQIKATEWVVVTDALIDRGVTADAPNLPTLIRAAIDDRLSPSREKVTATAQILLPDLEANTASEVQRVNLEAAQAIYFAAMMDEARLFDVVDKLAELFQIGALPLERSSAGEKLYQYIRKTPERISSYERRNTYARVFGTATGEPGATGAQFRNFDDLWIRFVSAVSDWYRKNQVESLFASNGSYVPSQEQVRKTGLDLAANLSLYCYGGTWFVASELQKDIGSYVDLLSSPEIKSLYGARDMWQVIDQVSLLEFGRPVNTIRARTMANAGAIIIGWLEKKSDAISHPGSELIDSDAIRNPARRSTSNAINDPTDYDLVTACEQWLAIEGVGSEVVDLKSDASPSATTTTSPIRVPPAAQEILGAFGFSHQGNGQHAGYTNGAAPRMG